MKQRGFTIVELLIVIVIIGILAAITIVAFNGVTDKANGAAASAAVAQANKKILTYASLNNDQLPADLATAGVNNSSNTTYQYSVSSADTPPYFCVTATTGKKSYYINNKDVLSPKTGGCPGHSQNGIATITNLITNPSIETDLSTIGTGGYGTNGAGTITRTNDGIDGWAATMTWTSTATGGGASLYNGGVPSSTTVQPNTQYTASVYCKTNQSVNALIYITLSSGSAVQSAPTAMSVNQWTRFSYTFTTGASDNAVAIGCRIPSLTGTSSGLTMKLDQAMLTQGSTVYQYADGNTTDWIWNGAKNTSTSTGIPK